MVPAPNENSTPQERDADHEEARWSQWMVAAQNGDRNAYRRLFHELTRQLLPYLKRRLGCVDLCEECLQDSLLAIHTARHSYDPARPFKPWAFTLVRYKTVDALRRKSSRRRYEVLEEGLEDYSEPAAPPSALPIDTARALAEIAPRYREAVLLTRFHGYTVAEAATRVGVSHGAMRSRAHRGMQQLRLRLSVIDACAQTGEFDIAPAANFS